MELKNLSESHKDSLCKTIIVFAIIGVVASIAALIAVIIALVNLIIS